MLEIIILFGLARYLARVAREKGRSSAWAALVVLFWLGGEVLGFVVGTLAGMEGMSVYGPALFCALIGGIIAFVIVFMLPAAKPEPDMSDHANITKPRFG